MIRYISKYFKIAVAILISVNFTYAQVLTFDHGKVDFYTSYILSDIKATSEDIEAKLDMTSGEVEIEIAIESFEFEYEMMQEHFNEEYMESDRFPSAIFIGKIDQDISKLETETEVVVSGELTIHGLTKKTNFKAILSKKEGFTKVKCKFLITFKDFNVENHLFLQNLLLRILS